MSNSTIYCLSGLGADYRAFKKLNIKGSKIEYIQWCPPLKNENLSNYAKRLSEQITDAYPILIGLSFGGMVAMELSKIIPCRAIILLASAKTKFELPWYYKLFGFLKIDKFFPFALTKKPNKKLSSWFFGLKNEDDINLLLNILNDTDITFTKWAIGQILRWQNTQEHANIFRAHGKNDRLLPCAKNLNNNDLILQAGHLLTLTHYSETSNYINQILEEIE